MRKEISIPLTIIGSLVSITGAISLSGAIGIVSDIIPGLFAGLILVIGLILILFGIIQNIVIKLYVVGINKPVKLKGALVDLEAIFILVRDRKEQNTAVV